MFSSLILPNLYFVFKLCGSMCPQLFINVFFWNTMAEMLFCWDYLSVNHVYRDYQDGRWLICFRIQNSKCARLVFFRGKNVVFRTAHEIFWNVFCYMSSLNLFLSHIDSMQTSWKWGITSRNSGQNIKLGNATFMEWHWKIYCWNTLCWKLSRLRHTQTLFVVSYWSYWSSFMLKL